MNWVLNAAIRVNPALILAIAVFAAAGLAYAQDTKVIRIGAGPTGMADFPFGGLVANAISNPPGTRDCERGGNCGVPGLIAVAQTTAGPAENLRAISRGDLELGLSQADMTAWAYQGAPGFGGEEPLTNLRVLARLYPSNVHLVTKKDSPIKSIMDLKGKRVAMGPEGSATAATGRFLLSAFGVKWTTVKMSYMDFAALPDAFKKNTVDAAFIVSGAPALVVEDLAGSVPIKLVPISGGTADKLAQVIPFYSRGVIPAGTYGDHPAVETIDVGSVLVSRDTMDPDLAFGIVRAIWHERNVGLFQAGHPRGRLMDKTIAARDIGVPIQTGADNYYVQNGLMDAAKIVPPPAKTPAKPPSKAARDERTATRS